MSQCTEIIIKPLDMMKRCDDCDQQRLNLRQLSHKLNETGMENVVLAEADCCIETDLCDTLDRKTKCVDEKIAGGTC